MPEYENDTLSIQRGDYHKNFFTKALFIAGRLASGPLQYALIQAHPLGRLGVAPPPTGGVIQVLGHQFPQMPFLTALMPTTLGIKHALWMSCWCRERITLPFTLFCVICDFIYESVSSMMYTAASINPLFSERQFFLGTTIFFAGMAIELVAELHRAQFKSKPENKGKLCTTGLWSVTRHINYTANVMFSFGVGLATGGPAYSIATAGMHVSNFCTNAIPGHESYCQQKYGKQWTEYEKRVPWKLIPGIY